MSGLPKIKILITGGNGNLARIIKNGLSGNQQFEITALGRADLNILSLKDIEQFLEKPGNNFDILVHTAILGGRRTKEDNGDVTHINLYMFENILKFADKFEMIINLILAQVSIDQLTF